VTRILIALALAVGLAAGGFWSGYLLGGLGTTNKLSKQAVAQQERVTRETIRLAKREKVLDAQARKNKEMIDNVKDKCADAPLPKPFSDLLR